jgi:AraC-like DNA-binding protein/mannose-6-phosphate isomerase-like protein (cupin superfamily)
MTSRHFINLGPRSYQGLPQAATVVFRQEYYRARVIHAEFDHYNKPLVRSPEPHRHDCYHVVLVTGGKGHFIVDGQRCPTYAGRIYFTGPGQFHQFMNTGNSSTRYSEVTFELISPAGESLQLSLAEMLELWTNQPCDRLSGATLSPAAVRHLEGKLVQMIELGRAQATDLELNIQLAEILMQVFFHAFQKTVPVHPQRLDAIRDYIRTHYQEKLSLTDLAARACLTPNYLSRHFKSLYGQTPIDYQIDLRLRSACGLLKTVNDTLDQIAHHVGFDDVYYFSRLFTKRIGQSPGRYRRQCL